MSVTPKFAVATDPRLVDGDSLVKPRLRFVGHNVYPDGLETKVGGLETKDVTVTTLVISEHKLLFIVTEKERPRERK